MTIKEIELYNFRIYKGTNTIDLTSEGKKNIFVVKVVEMDSVNDIPNVNGLVPVW